MACALRGDSDKIGVKLPGEGDVYSLETKLCMPQQNFSVLYT